MEAARSDCPFKIAPGDRKRKSGARTDLALEGFRQVKKTDIANIGCSSLPLKSPLIFPDVKS
jgi:hypothetical protein